MDEAKKADTPPPAPGWAKAPFNARCNFHRDRVARFAFGGTPLCDECVKRVHPGD
jgi:hypothetical protein